METLIRAEKVEFEEIFEQNKRRMHYQQYQLWTRPGSRRGIFPLSYPYRKIQPDLGLLATYLNYSFHDYHVSVIREETDNMDYSHFFRKKYK